VDYDYLGGDWGEGSLSPKEPSAVASGAYVLCCSTASVTCLWSLLSAFLVDVGGTGVGGSDGERAV
jgi:hypothetical protein